MNDYKLCVVEWYDAQGDTRWVSAEEAMEMEPPLIRSIGWLLRQDEKKLVICNSMDYDSGDVGGRDVIPMGCVKNIITIDKESSDGT